MERTYSCHISSQHLGKPLGSQNIFFYYNQGVVDIWKARTTKSIDIMALVRMLYFLAAKHTINVIITHIILQVLTMPLLMLFLDFRMAVFDG